MIVSELASFNALGARLELGLQAPAQLSDHPAGSRTQVVRVHLVPYAFPTPGGDVRPLTAAEFDAVAFPAPEIRLRGEGGRVVSHRAPNGAFFTVRALFQAIEETERRTRGASDWLGDVDDVHIYFEGIQEERDGVWAIQWGS